MTQMGLEYQKLQESKRHNVVDEGIRNAANTISQQEADTRAYSASFKPQEVANDTLRAHASQKDADTRRLSHELQSRYAERDMLTKEKTANASAKQADVADRRYSPEQLERSLVANEKQADAKMISSKAQEVKNEIERIDKLLKMLPDQLRVYEAGKHYGGESYGAGAAVLNQYNQMTQQIQDSLNALRALLTRGLGYTGIFGSEG